MHTLSRSLAIVLLGAAVITGASDATAQSRDIGARRLVLDDGTSAFKLTIESPPLTQNGTFTFPDPATTSGSFVMTNSTAGQTIGGPLTLTGSTITIGDAATDQLVIPAIITSSGAGDLIRVQDVFGGLGLAVTQTPDPYPIVSTSTVVSRQYTRQVNTDGSNMNAALGTSIILQSDNADATQRTINILNGYPGQIVHLIGANNGNASEVLSAGNVRLAGGATMTFGPHDILTLIWNGTTWLEISRSINAD